MRGESQRAQHVTKACSDLRWRSRGALEKSCMLGAGCQWSTSYNRSTPPDSALPRSCIELARRCLHRHLREGETEAWRSAETCPKWSSQPTHHPAVPTAAPSAIGWFISQSTRPLSPLMRLCDPCCSLLGIYSLCKPCPRKRYIDVLPVCCVI